MEMRPALMPKAARCWPLYQRYGGLKRRTNWEFEDMIRSSYRVKKSNMYRRNPKSSVRKASRKSNPGSDGNSI
jgi:hypothetical protein